MTEPQPVPTTDIMDALAQMMAKGVQRRAERANTAWATLRPYERRILREAAVMGYVLGYRAGDGDRLMGHTTLNPAAFPTDTEIISRVIEHCDSYSGGYEYLTDACAGFRRRVTRKRAYPGEYPPPDLVKRARNRCYRSGLHGGGLHLPECPDATPDTTP